MDNQIIAGGGWGGAGQATSATVDWDALDKAYPTVKAVPMFIQNADGSLREVPGRIAVVREDTGAYIANHSDGYQIAQHASTFRYIAEGLGAAGAFVSSGGTFKNGALGYLSAKLPNGIASVKGVDEIHGFLNLFNSHDGSLGLVSKVNGLRTICQNTFYANLRENTDVSFLVKHTRNMDVKIEKMIGLLAEAGAVFARFAENAEFLATQRFTDADFKSMLEAILPAKTTVKGELSARTLNQHAKLERLFAYGKGQYEYAEIRGTKWAAFNAFTEYADHFRSTNTKGGASEDEARTLSATLGSGQELKGLALAYLNGSPVRDGKLVRAA